MNSVRGNYVRPSAAHTWIICSGSIDMRAKFPEAPDEADSEVTEDGTACHWLASETWEGRVLQEGTIAPNGRVLTEEMFDAVDVYHGVLNSWQGVHAVCEQHIPIPRIMQGMWGTPDAFAYNPDTKTLYIADLKFGFRFVEVWDNYQLICYACGLMDHLGLTWADTNIVFTIVQPRSFHREGPVRTWKTTANDILPHVMALSVAANQPTMYTPNPGCYDCPGRHECSAYHNSALQACEVSYGGGTTHELSPAAIGAMLRLLNDADRKITGLKTGLSVQAEAMIASGVTIPGWQVAPTFAREAWIAGAEVHLMTLAEKYYGNPTITKPPKLITPNQARKLLPTDVVAMYAHKPSTGVKLTPVSTLDARKAFDNK